VESSYKLERFGNTLVRFHCVAKKIPADTLEGVWQEEQQDLLRDYTENQCDEGKQDVAPVPHWR
jgi:hypothetical protein